MQLSIDSRITTRFVEDREGGFLGRGSRKVLVERQIGNWEDQAPVKQKDLTLACEIGRILQNKLKTVGKLVEVINIRFRPARDSQEGKGPIMEVKLILHNPFRSEDKLEVIGCHRRKGLLGGPLVPGFDTASLSAEVISDDLVRDIKKMLSELVNRWKPFVDGWQSAIEAL